jgi:hypothetical protein
MRAKHVLAAAVIVLLVVVQIKRESLGGPAELP